MLPLIPVVAWVVGGAATAVGFFNKQKMYSNNDDRSAITTETNNITKEANNNKMKSFVWIGATILLGLFFWW
jgi:predicted histidine transporter YuiF (NhaC family)